jgi:hypothetical protein
VTNDDTQKSSCSYIIYTLFCPAELPVPRIVYNNVKKLLLFMRYVPQKDRRAFGHLPEMRISPLILFYINIYNIFLYAMKITSFLCKTISYFNILNFWVFFKKKSNKIGAQRDGHVHH